VAARRPYDRGARQVAAIHAEPFLGCENFHLGIHAQQICQATHVIAVPMRHDDEIELGQVDAFGPGVLRKSIAVVSRVAQNALPTVLNERGIAPVLLHRRRLAECVIEHGDLRRPPIACWRGDWWGRRSAGGEQYSGSCQDAENVGSRVHFVLLRAIASITREAGSGERDRSLLHGDDDLESGIGIASRTW